MWDNCYFYETFSGDMINADVFTLERACEDINAKIKDETERFGECKMTRKDYLKMIYGEFGQFLPKSIKDDEEEFDLTGATFRLECIGDTVGNVKVFILIKEEKDMNKETTRVVGLEKAKRDYELAKRAYENAQADMDDYKDIISHLKWKSDNIEDAVHQFGMLKSEIDLYEASHMMPNLVLEIGEAAMYEQAAEEASEFAKACLKMARGIRKENNPHKPYADILRNYEEEFTDMLICLYQLGNCRAYEELDLTGTFKKKLTRMCSRLGIFESEE